MILFSLLKDKEFVKALGKMPDSEVAKKFEVSQATVFKARKELKVACCKGGHSTYRKLPEDITVLKMDLKTLGSYAAVARKYGVSRQVVTKRLSKEIKK